MELYISFVLCFLMCALFIFCEYWNNKVQNNQDDQRKKENEEYQTWRSAFSSDLDATLKTQRELEFKKNCNQDYYMSLDPFEFEGYVCNVLNHYGYNLKTTVATSDGGKDLISPDGRMYGEVKQYADYRPIGRPYIQKLVGSGTADNVKEFVFITTSRFSKEAIIYAKECEERDIKIRLIDGKEFKNMVYELKKAPNC